MTDTLLRLGGRYVARIEAVGRDDLAFAGGKGANLGEMMRAGFPVPDGFVISTDAYTAVVEHADLAAAITDGVATGEVTPIRAAFERIPIPATVTAAITDGYAAMGDGPVAVRSSATAEDLAGAAFAGQQDTELNVVGTDALLNSVRRCWGSLWSERAVAYRRHRRIDSADLRIAVVVQRMVDAEFAGVMFTANPVTGDRTEVVIDASPGLGEAVASGQVTPDHYVVDANGRVQERTEGRRELVIRSASGGGVRQFTDLNDTAMLADQVIAQLAATGRAIAKHFGRPQDVEWAYAGGRMWLLQSRPMTALPPPPERLNRLQRKLGLQLMDYLSVRPYPLDMTGWIAPGIGRMVERMLAEVPGLRVDVSEMLPEHDGVVERFSPQVPRPTVATLTTPVRLPRQIRRYDPAVWTTDSRYHEFDQAVRKLSSMEVASLDWSQLLRLVRQTLAAADIVTDLRVDYLPRTAFDLLRLWQVLRLLRLGQLFGQLTLGARTRTGDANLALEELASRVRADPALAQAFAESEPAELSGRLEVDTAFADFRDALHSFLDEYGHRETVSPLLVSAPTWGQAPQAVLGLVKVLAEEPPHEAPGTAVANAEDRLFEHRLVRLTRSRNRLLRLLEAVRLGIAFREDTHFHATRVLPPLRGLLLEAGRRLVAVEVLGEAAEVFHLRLEELEAVTDPERLRYTDGDRLRSAVRVRAARRAELAGVPMLTAAELTGRSRSRQDALVEGIGASGGRVSGPVRVIREPAEFGALRSGDVLVCPYTNPAWTPLFQRAAAVVVDSGGLGSHAAIVAREYGIPAVMGTRTGTAVLVDGRQVTVDGDTGRVTGATA